jgi:ring-1,2-phenylacetyl-CoA epoxidase subunit PaaC
MIDLSPAGRSYLLAFADDEHMIGSRHANWIGLGPFLEEDLAFCSIAQDELGHALALYEMFIPAEEINRFALLRDPRDYRSCALAELECGSWDLALVRHWLYDTAEQLKWRALLQSSITEVAALAEQALRDEAFHTEHAAMFLSRVSADPEATTRVESALTQILPTASSVWTAPDHEADAIAEGFVTHSSTMLGSKWSQLIAEQLAEFGLNGDLTLLGEPTTRNERSDGFDAFHQSLGEVISLDPSAIW